MKALHLCLFALLVSGPVPAQSPDNPASEIPWTKRSSHPFKSGRIDSWYHLVTDDFGLRRAIIMRSFDAPRSEWPDDFASMIYVQDFDCAARTFRLGLFYWYDGPRGTGRLLRNEDAFSDPQPLGEAEEARFFFRELCR